MIVNCPRRVKGEGERGGGDGKGGKEEIGMKTAASVGNRERGEKRGVKKRWIK